MKLSNAIHSLLAGHALTRKETAESIKILLLPETPVEQVSAFLSLLCAKKATVPEILGALDTLQQQLMQVTTTQSALDIVGTGGGNVDSVNISTGASILAASAGVKIAKHGNRAASSLCGAADVLEALHIDIEMPARKITACIEQLGIAFSFAPKFLPALAKLREIRKNLGFPTILNTVGPFLSPVNVQHYFLGVSSRDLLQPFADVLSALPLKKSAVVHSAGFDELTCMAIADVIEIEHGRQSAYQINPADLGFQTHDESALRGGDAACNAKLLIEAFSGQSGPIADTLILNAGMAVYLYGLTPDLKQGIALAKQHLLAGAALRLLQSWQNYSKEARDA